jgi:hypothetical protein
MHPLCTLSRHHAAPVTLENQGFLFSKCRRCSHDLVSSWSTPPSWQAVPEGFRVSWRETDLSVFPRISLARRAWHRVRRSAAATLDVTHLAATIIGWQATDGARTLKAKVEDAYRSSKSLLRLPERKSSTCVVIVNLTPDAFGVLLRGRTAEVHA